MKKRVLSMLLVIALVLSVMPAVYAADTATSGVCGENLTWSFDEATGTLTINGEGAMSNYEIYEWGSNIPWDPWNGSIQTVVIKEGVTSIGEYAFSSCGMAEISIPDTVSNIGISAFRWCSNLTSVTIPENITSIHEGTFYWCSGLTSVTLPDGLGFIGPDAFALCENLTSITIPASVYQIAPRAFDGCTNLSNITVLGTSCDISSNSRTMGIPGTTIIHGFEKSSAYYYAANNGYTFTAHEFDNGVCTFCGINSVVSGIADETIEWSLNTETGELRIEGGGEIKSLPWDNYKSIVKHVEIADGITSIPSWAFSFYDSIVSVQLGNGIDEIPSNCFYSCDNLKSVELPDSITWISSGAFQKCIGLTDIYFGIGSAPYISDDSFTDVTATIHYPKGNITWADEIGSSYGGSITWEAYEIGTIGGTCGNNLTWTIEDGILIISGTGSMENFAYVYSTDPNANIAPWYAYRDYIIGISISDSVTNIGDYAFQDCCYAKSVSISKNTTRIGNCAFGSCTSLAGITIPKSVTTIGEGAFFNCDSLTSITLPDSITTISNAVFEHCDNLTNVTIPNSISSIGDGAFYYCCSLTSIAIPDGVTAIGEGVFWYCTSLTEVKFQGSAPAFEDFNCFLDVIATAYYPSCNETWTEDILLDYGGDLTWIGVHAEEEVKNAKDATCTAKGYTGDKVCSECSEVLEKGTEIPMTAHTEVTDAAVAATCTTDGKTAGKHCSVCKAVITAQESIPAKGHSFGAWTQVKAPTTEAEGLEERKCACGEKEQRTIDKLAPTPTEPTPTEPTPTEPTPTEPTDPPPEFVDVASGAFYEDAVAWAVSEGVTNGTSDTTFSPDNKCTRAQVVTFLWRAADCPAPTSSDNPFTDVGKAYYTDAVLWAVEEGITTGMSPTTFAPDAVCTRAQVVTFLHRAFGEPAASGFTPFTDVGQAYYTNAVVWAVEEGITTGMSPTTFAPDSECTRGQIVTFLHRAYN